MALRRASNDQLNAYNNTLNDDLSQALEDRTALVEALEREAEALRVLLAGEAPEAPAAIDAAPPLEVDHLVAQNAELHRRINEALAVPAAPPVAPLSPAASAERASPAPGKRRKEPRRSVLF